LLNLPSDVQQLIASGELSTDHAKVILGLSKSDDQLKLARAVISRNLSVRETEKILQSSLLGRKRAKTEVHRSPWSEVEERLQKRLGTRVTVLNGRRGGRIIIHYFSPSELDGLLETILN
jgi:ParB family chromosome partitioning protein